MQSTPLGALQCPHSACSQNGEDWAGVQPDGSAMVSHSFARCAPRNTTQASSCKPNDREEPCRATAAKSPRASRQLSKANPGLSLKVCGISVAFGTASFFMTDNQRTVRVDVCQRLLASLEEPAPTSKAQYAKRLLRYRARFAQIASAKYLEGQVEFEVNVLVVRITARDLS